MSDENKGRVQNPWLQHVSQFRTDNPGITYKEALRRAASTYSKKERETKSEEPKKNPWMEHINSWKSANPDWKNNYTYKQVLQTCKATYNKENQDPNVNVSTTPTV